ncbi:MAG: imidazoleglycerol-phosphate dehydratase HisB [Deltaproteobacteria bacterium]|nr:imidazoleglycerol-phosphate dehydratase HisB [Deltaproteobacteria bacterium]NIS78539.1 imidazoleglycerol-phosphate dehydratase HisB [Deltaproteobacteria bacterium]
MERKGKFSRSTKETSIDLSINLDGTGQYNVDTGVPFFDHMLSLLAKHGLFDLHVKATGDIEVDYHHLVEDTAIVLGAAVKEALGDLKGIKRYGFAAIPMIEAYAEVAVDISNRPHHVFRCEVQSEKVGRFDTELVEEFVRAFSQSSGVCVHVNVPYGSNAHHTIEAIFKAIGRALDMATLIDERTRGIPSTKGVM